MTKHINSKERMIELFQLVIEGRKLEVWCDVAQQWEIAAISNGDGTGDISRHLKYRVKPLNYDDALANAIDVLDDEEWGNNEEYYQSMFDKGMEYQTNLDK